MSLNGDLAAGGARRQSTALHTLLTAASPPGRAARTQARPARRPRPAASCRQHRKSGRDRGGCPRRPGRSAPRRDRRRRHRPGAHAGRPAGPRGRPVPEGRGRRCRPAHRPPHAANFGDRCNNPFIFSQRPIYSQIIRGYCTCHRNSRNSRNSSSESDRSPAARMQGQKHYTPVAAPPPTSPRPAAGRARAGCPPAARPRPRTAPWSAARRRSSASRPRRRAGRAPRPWGHGS